MRNPIETWRGNRSPFREIQQQMDRLMEEFSTWPVTELQPSGIISPRCNMSEDAGHFYLNVEMPGISKDQIKVELNNNILSISAERKEEKKREDEKQYYAEFSFGSFFRSMTLPTPVDEKKIDASFENGILHLTVPKAEGAKAKQIAVH
jgi:HSP20 family protein